jgi:CRISPR type IV-associated protein Csf3
MYKITFSLNHTILQTTPHMLDGILARTWLMQNRPELYSEKPMYEKGELFDFAKSDFPIEFDDQVGCFLASQIFLVGKTQEFVTSEKKRFNEKRSWLVCEKDQGTAVDTQRGEYKSASVPRVGFVATSAVAYFEGNAEQVAELLKNIVGLGKKVSKAYGWLRGSTIEEVEGEFWDKHFRPTPLIFAQQRGFSGQIRNIRLVPPYHQFIDAVPCICPPIKLDELRKK